MLRVRFIERKKSDPDPLFLEDGIWNHPSTVFLLIEIENKGYICIKHMIFICIGNECFKKDPKTCKRRKKKYIQIKKLFRSKTLTLK